jgi:hypothetical protein
MLNHKVGEDRTTCLPRTRGDLIRQIRALSQMQHSLAKENWVLSVPKMLCDPSSATMSSIGHGVAERGRSRRIQVGRTHEARWGPREYR